MQQPPRTGSGRAVTFQQHDDDDDSDLASELDLDLYDTDEVPDDRNVHSMSLSGIPSILNRDSVMTPTPHYARAAQPVIKEGQLSDTASNPPTLQDTASSAGGSSQRRLFPRRPVNPNPTIRTDFTTTHHGAMDDNYELLATPPGEPPPSRPEEGLHPACAQPPRKELSMRAEWLIGLISVGIGIGIAVGSQDPDPQLSYWLKTIGDLYVRMTACVTLPLAFCQVITSTAELVNNGKLRRAWLYTMLYFGIMVMLSAWVGVLCAGAFQSSFRLHSPQSYRLAHAKFAFKCADGTYIEQPASGPVRCTGTSVNANTTFPRMVDISQRLGLEESVGNVNVSGYIFALMEVYFPVNIVYSLSRDNFLSALMVALVLGIAVGKSYTCAPGEIKRSKNPLFRLFTHVYLSLFAMNDWIQKLALWAVVPLLMGSVLEMPNATNTLQLTRYYIVAVLIACFAQCLVVVPAMFFIVTRQNPYRWITRMLAPMSYGMVLSSAFYPLPMATKAALRSNAVSPSVFGAVYPILSVMNRSHFAIGVPCGLLYCAAFSGCAIDFNGSNVMLLFAFTCLGSLGDTMLPRSGMAFFLMTWRTFCENEDTPPAMLMIATVGLLIFRLAAFVGIMTNMQLIRMISHAVEKDDNKLQNHLDSIFTERRPESASAVSLASSSSPTASARVI